MQGGVRSFAELIEASLGSQGNLCSSYLIQSFSCLGSGGSWPRRASSFRSF
jgi:hypothetical protein